jgi:large subunit ribosomal protein L41e
LIRRIAYAQGRDAAHRSEPMLPVADDDPPQSASRLNDSDDGGCDPPQSVSRHVVIDDNELNVRNELYGNSEKVDGPMYGIIGNSTGSPGLGVSVPKTPHDDDGGYDPPQSVSRLNDSDGGCDPPQSVSRIDDVVIDDENRSEAGHPRSGAAQGTSRNAMIVPMVKTAATLGSPIGRCSGDVQERDENRSDAGHPQIGRCSGGVQERDDSVGHPHRPKRRKFSPMTVIPMMMIEETEENGNESDEELQLAMAMSLSMSQELETTGEFQASGSVAHAPAAGKASSGFPKARSMFRWKWKKKRTRRLQKKRRKMRQRSTATAPADTCQTLSSGGLFSAASTGGLFSAASSSGGLFGGAKDSSLFGNAASSGNPYGGAGLFWDSGACIGDGLTAPAGEANSRFPTATAPADIKNQEQATHPPLSQLQVGTYVIVQKLKNAKNLNGTTGKIIGYNSITRRYEVQLTMTPPTATPKWIKATNLEAVIQSEDEEEWADIIMDDTEEWMEIMAYEGTDWYNNDEEALTKLMYDKDLKDFDNPHFRRVASKLLKAGILLHDPERMNEVSIRLHRAREKEAFDIMERQGARTITRDEIMQLIMADPEIEHEFGTKLL